MVKNGVGKREILKLFAVSLRSSNDFLTLILHFAQSTSLSVVPHTTSASARILVSELMNCNVSAETLLSNPPHRSYAQSPCHTLMSM